ncbi:MAG: ferritin-like domain-containing protein [Actinobacteria bacterium]|nr:ferritin-like domain-containing protein [Actinomycetota bacterium]
MSSSKLVAPELASIEIKGITRHAFMMRSAIAAGSVYGLSTVGPFVSRAIAQEGGGDVDILNFALTLEYLENAFYDQAVKTVPDLGDGSDGAKKLAETLRDNEKEHVDALTSTIKDLGGKPVAAPGVDFGKAFADKKTFLQTAQTFEDLGVSAYNGAAPRIQSKEVLGAAGSIVQVEARHAAAIRLLNKKPITDGAFDKPLEMEAVLKAAKPFIKP